MPYDEYESLYEIPPHYPRKALSKSLDTIVSCKENVEQDDLIQILNRCEAQLRCAISNFDKKGSTLSAVINDVDNALQTIKFLKETDEYRTWPSDENKKLLYNYKRKCFLLEDYLKTVKNSLIEIKNKEDDMVSKIYQSSREE